MSDHRFKFQLISTGRKLQDGRIVRAIQALHAEPSLNGSALAQMLGLSSRHVQHLFKAQMGMTISAYTREVRLHRASELLETTWLPVKQIRYDVGIPDPSHFARHFKKRFGVSPSAYRKQCDSVFGQQIALSAN